MSQALQFNGKVVLITGAGGGLGREYALAFAARGASVVVNDLGGSADGKGKSTSLADKVVEEIRGAGGTAVANYESVEDGEKLVKKALEAFGRIDILINNAGILRDRSFSNMTEQDWDSVYRVHLRGSFLVTKAVWPHMKKQGYGRIIMTSSTSGVYGNYGQANYGAAKTGLFGLSNVLALEGAKYHILCNAIVPIAGSRLTQNTMASEMFEKVSPKLVAPFVLYLCHESCTETKGLFFITGGFGAQLRWQQSAGVNLRSGEQEVTPEMVRDNWAAINDWSKASFPKTTIEGTASALYGTQPSEEKSPITEEGAFVHTYSSKDVIQYALGVGVTAKDDYSHLKFLYEGHEDFSVLPTFAVIPAQGVAFGGAIDVHEEIKNLDLSKALHGEHYLELYRPLAPNSCLKSKLHVAEVLDKGSGAVIVSNVTTSDEKGPVSFNQFVVFALGSGGFGGKRRSEHIKPLVPKPHRAPDAVEEEQVPQTQAAQYRMTGDRNPLHVDPAFSSMAGFPVPILHGLCSFGYAVRHVLKHFCGNDVTKFKAAKVRFSKPMLPGQTIRTEMWKEGNRVLIECKVAETGDVILSGGYVELHNIDKSSKKAEVVARTAASTLKCDALFQLMSDRLPTYPHLAKKVKASFLWRITEGGKVKSEWTTDFTQEPGSVFHGKPSGKPNCTVTISDEDFVDVAMGTTNAQQLFMKGKIKIAGSIMLAQKLQIIMKEIDLKKEIPTASGEKPSPKADLKSRAVFEELRRRLKSMPDVAKNTKGSFLWNVTKNGKTAGQWLVDLKPDQQTITEGAPSTKPDCTVTVADDDLTDMFAGKTNPQKLFMNGGLKVAGNIGMMMKLGELLKPQAKL